jgi:hypothetical protein
MCRTFSIHSRLRLRARFLDLSFIVNVFMRIIRIHILHFVLIMYVYSELTATHKYFTLNYVVLRRSWLVSLAYLYIYAIDCVEMLRCCG